MASIKKSNIDKACRKPVGINKTQVYSPTTDYSENDIEEFYEQVDSVRRQCKAEEVNFVMGDLKAKVGRGRSGTDVGNCGLG